MQLRTKRLFERLQRRKEILCADLSSWARPQLSFRPGPSEWSAAEVLDHLVRTEKSILSTMVQCRGSRNDIEFAGRARNFLVRIVMWLPFKVRVPELAAATIWPGEVKGVGILIAEWNAQRDALSDFLRELTVDESSAAIFRHPVGGWTDIYGALRFVQSHIAHHQYQLRRIKRRALRLTIL